MPTDEQSHPIERHDEHVFLAAGAGSGKTRVLVRRYLKYLEDHRWDPALPARMLAITFTEKAALEMRERVTRALREEAAGAGEEAAARLRLLEREMEAAPISTIHGFCSRLLREHAVEAGLDPLFRVPDELEQHALRESVLDRLFAEGDEDLRLLAAEMGLEQLVPGLTAFRDLRRSLGLDPEEMDPEAELAAQETLAREKLRRLFDQDLRALPARLEALCAHFDDGLHPREKGRKQLAEATAHLRGGEPGAATLDLALGALKGIPQKLEDGDRFRKSLDKLRKEMKEIRAGYVELDRPQPPERPRGLRRSALALAARSESLYRAEMRARGWLDFEDLQREALRLLETRPVLRERLREQYRQVFVDEFQDTNPLQMRLVRALVPEGEPAGERALFLVGDHRQSIYAFRNADLDVFLREGERMEALGQKRELRLNWRSRARLIDFFNEIFPQGDFPPMATKDKDAAEPRVLLQMTARGKERKTPEARREMAEHLAELLWRTHESGLEVRDRVTGEMRAIEWSDMAVLLRSGSVMGILARALADRNIPYEAVGGRDYFLRQELRDLEDLVAALDDPFHRLKLAQALRGDIIGLSNADLLALLPPREAKGERDGGELLGLLLGDPPAALSEDGRRRLAIFRRLHGEFRRRLHRESLSELIPALVRTSGFEIQAATGPWGLKVQRNLRQLADLVGELEANGPLAVRDFLDYMDRVRELSPRREEAWVPEEGEKTLRILTIHSAKGLEFPLVVVADLDRDLGRVQIVPRMASLRAGGGGEPLRAMLGLGWKRGDEDAVDDAVRQWIRRESRRREDAELRRLLYVACTRARDWLVLTGVADERCEITEPAVNPKASFLDALRENLAAPVEKGLCRVAWTGEGPVPELGGGLPRVEAAPPAPLGEPAWEPLLTPPPDPGRPELAVTGLAALGACPLRWMLEKRLGLRGRGRPLHAEEGPPRERYAGADFGTLVHNILQHWDFRADPAAAFEDACPPGLERGARDAVRELLLGFFERGGAWIERLARAEKLRREESFVLELEKLTLVGQVDLVLEADGQRFLVDWKSDQVDAEGAKERRHHYEMQMALYALALEKAGRPADRAFLAFLRPARFLEVRIEAQNLRWAAARAEKLGALAREMSRSEAPPPPQDPPCRGCPWLDHFCPESYRGGDKS